MNLSPPPQYAMTQINRAFMVGDQTALVAALNSVHLPELLSQDMHGKVRTRGNCVIPGRTDTDMRSTKFNNEEQDILDNTYEVAISASRIICDNANGTLACVQ